jgi:diaminopimelate decarboxylase
VAPARLALELGRYPVAQAGWYLTSVLAQQTYRGRPAVVVDGGTQQRGDMCGLGLRLKGFAPVVIPAKEGRRVPTDMLGCLSLPGDVPAEARLLPPLVPGDVLAFPNAGAYGLAASPWLFHSHPAPAQVAFDGTRATLAAAPAPRIGSRRTGSASMRLTGWKSSAVRSVRRFRARKSARLSSHSLHRRSLSLLA